MIPDYSATFSPGRQTTRQRPAWLSPGRWLPSGLRPSTPRASSLPPVAPVRRCIAALLIVVLADRRGSSCHRGNPASTASRRPSGPRRTAASTSTPAARIVAANVRTGAGRQTINLGVGIPASRPLPQPRRAPGSRSSRARIPTTARRAASLVGRRRGRCRTHDTDHRATCCPDIDPTSNPERGRRTAPGSSFGADQTRATPS